VLRDPHMPPATLLPIVGTVRAGVPEPPQEDIEGELAVDPALLRSGGRFWLKVRGDSMIEAAIRDGDLALIRPQSSAADRDIVVALVDGEATLKRFFREKGAIRLQPENARLKPIVIRDGAGEVTIVGKVVALLRREL
jgi:repressor LexA